MASHHYSPGRSPDDQLREKARILQFLRDTNPEFVAKRQVSPGRRQNGLPFKPASPLGGHQGQPQGRTWSQERRRLDQEKQKLQEEHDKVAQARKRWSLPSAYNVLDPIDKRPQSNEDRWKSDIDNFVLKTQDQIPQMIINLQKMKDELSKDKEEMKNAALVLSAPKSYKPWQMADYYLVRDLLLDLIDEAIERSEGKPKPKPHAVKVQQQALVAAERDMNTDRKRRQQERIVELLAEEIILEMTGLVVRQTAEEYLSLQRYTGTLKKWLVMQSAEAVVTGNSSGRAEDDPAYGLVTSTYDQMGKDRNVNRKDSWAHSQKLHLQTTASNTEQNVVMDSLAPDLDTIPLNLLHLPVNVGRPPDPQSAPMKQFRELETAYWRTFSSGQESIALTKKVQGVVTAAISPHHRYLALGCLRGDVLVYSLTDSQPIPIRCIQNESAQTDAVIHISWCLDSSRLLTINETGILQLWSMSSGGVSQKDIRDLDLGTQSGLPEASQLTQLLALDADQSDLNFQEGPLKEAGVHATAVGPTVSVFHPSHTLLATQNTIVVGLENGDILKCNTSSSPDVRLQNMETASHQQVTLKTQTNYIGHDVPTELFRCHKSALLFLGFVGSHGNMVSMDTGGLICEWQCSRDTFSHFGWFEPSAKYQLELAERVYSPRPDDKPKVHFSDSALAEKKVSRQERLASREKASQRLDKIQMDVLWHKEMNTSSTVLHVYCPKKVQEAGSVFHGVLRHSGMDTLLKHYTYYCQPAKNFCSRVLKVQQTPCGMKLVLMLLFPAFSPKGPHISFVVLNLSNMSVSDTRIDVSLTEEEHTRCLKEELCSFGMTPLVSVTGSQYLIACIIGTVHIFSMETTLQVMATSLETLSGSRIKKAVAEKLCLLVAMSKGNINILTYTPKYNSVDILQLIDKNPVRTRRRMYDAYISWRGKKPGVPSEQQLHQWAWSMDGDAHRHVELFAHRLVLQLASVAVYVSEGLPIDKDQLRQFWNEDKQTAESDMLLRILAGRRGDAISDTSSVSRVHTPQTPTTAPPASQPAS